MDTNKSSMYLFYGSSNPLSNWHPKGFWVKGIWFPTSEHFMMYCKAKLFNDEESATLILKTTDPGEAKRLGRKVRNFDKATWDDKSEGYVYIGVLEKFRQNPSAGAFLMSLRGREIVEASPTDVIWGVGLAANDAKIYDRTKWLGENRLGQLLERVRDTLIEEHERKLHQHVY